MFPFSYTIGDGSEVTEHQNSENPDDSNSTDDDQYRLNVDVKVCHAPQFLAILKGFMQNLVHLSICPRLLLNLLIFRFLFQISLRFHRTCFVYAIQNLISTV